MLLQKATKKSGGAVVKVMNGKPVQVIELEEGGAQNAIMNEGFLGECTICSIKFLEIVQTVGFFTSAEVAERIGEAV